MADLANISLTGRMGADAQVTETPNSSVANFSLAVNGFKKDEVSWFNCEAWGKVGEIVAKYGEKGKQVAVAGTIRIENWTDKEGNKRQTPKINVRDLTLLGGSNEKAEAKTEAQDDIPF